jgi:TfoX/Sxy family transcriptional regulator of competence genes
LLEQIRNVLAGRRDVTERKMFGGVAFMVNGHMCCGCLRGSLVLRLGEEHTRIALGEPHVEPMDFTGKVLKTMVYVRPPGLQRAQDLTRWVIEAVEFAMLPSPKRTKRPRKRS